MSLGSTNINQLSVMYHKFPFNAIINKITVFFTFINRQLPQGLTILEIPSRDLKRSQEILAGAPDPGFGRGV